MLTLLRNRLTEIYRSLYFPPIVIAAAILVATGVTWRASRQSLNHDIQAAVNVRINTTEQSIRSSLNAYDEILRGGVGLFQGSNEVTREDFSRYLQAFNITTDYSSVQGIGYIAVVSDAQLPGFTTYMQGQGIADYQIHPTDPTRDTHAVIQYVQLYAATSRPNFGFDMYSETNRRTALFRARDTASTTITGPIRSVAANQNASRSAVGFNLYTPYYDSSVPHGAPSERQTAIRGFMFAGFRADRFFQGSDRITASRDIAYSVRVADKQEGDLYHSENFNTLMKRSNTIRTSHDLPLYGETWRLQYVFDKTSLVSDVQLRRPISVLFAGVFTAVLIALVVFLLLRARAQELAAQKEQAVDLAKDELLSLASHQLRTPATGVKQYLGMVLQGFAGPIPKDQQSLLEKAYASNDRQLSVINEILHLAKIDAGRIVLALQDVDLGGLVDDIINEQEPDIQKARHTLLRRMPKRPIIVSADTHTLRMAIENILSNAIKYTPDGGEINVRVWRNDQCAFVRVKDNGVGIAQADIDKLFKQFSRLPNEMSLRVGGTGIGLYLAKHLVELHGGHIDVLSSANHGSSFTIVLPLELPEQI